ncbi:MAG: hypothetical protein NTZ98_11705 [Acidobacteria bacterium]|nr:hypothetical protein [Acidobacteriota bacterium]
MTSYTTARFRKASKELPPNVKRAARRAYKLFVRDPWHPSLQFKQIHPIRPVFSARVGIGYRAMGTREGNQVLWFWIGSHAEYNRLVSQIRRR